MYNSGANMHTLYTRYAYTHTATVAELVHITITWVPTNEIMARLVGVTIAVHHPAPCTSGR